MSYEIPDFLIPYKVVDPHPNSARLARMSHDWLATHEVDKQLGPEIWDRLVKHNTPDVLTHILPEVDDKEFFLICKYILVLYAVDTVLDDTPIGKDVEKSLVLLLDVITVLMWDYPEDPTLLTSLTPLYNLVSSETSKKSVDLFKARLAQAKLKTACDFKLLPVALAWKDFWADYQSYGLPYDYNVRLAHGLLDWLTSCFQEAHFRSSDTSPDLVDYITFRRRSSATRPAIVGVDAIISTRAPGIPTGLFHSHPMQRLLLAITDFVSWDNDVFSVYKECIVNKDKHNLVHIISVEQGCTYTKAAAEFARKMIYDTIVDMERAILDLREAASDDDQPAVEIYAATCRNWVSGLHAWHAKSVRYKAHP
ncbi:hypothetical protein Mapa_012055 [Marchantia paleacea]|nr:hypothetical protein Mapa_012055 [Marchantia paleacea]